MFAAPSAHETVSLGMLAPETVLNGTMRSWNTDKGYGFCGVDNGPDIFIHQSEVINMRQ